MGGGSRSNCSEHRGRSHRCRRTMCIWPMRARRRVQPCSFRPIVFRAPNATHRARKRRRERSARRTPPVACVGRRDHPALSRDEPRSRGGDHNGAGPPTTALLAAFAVLALLLAAVGVYGVLSGDVTRRRKEIGIRLALGANGAAVTSMVLRRALDAGGCRCGDRYRACARLARSMSALVFGIGAYDAATFGVVTVALLVVATCASIIPAVRATRVSPLEAIARIDPGCHPRSRAPALSS